MSACLFQCDSPHLQASARRMSADVPKHLIKQNIEMGIIDGAHCRWVVKLPMYCDRVIPSSLIGRYTWPNRYVKTVTRNDNSKNVPGYGP